MNPWLIALSNSRFRKHIPEFMEPPVKSGFIAIVSLVIWEECFPFRELLADDTVITAKQIQHLCTNVNDTGFPTLGLPDEYLAGHQVNIRNA